jgi:DNA-binding transcriptional regulator YdaS (Cro superfamily)
MFAMKPATMTLGEYTKLARGHTARLARAMKVSTATVSNWASELRDVPEDRAPSIEYLTGFQVRVETLCPLTRWIRVRDPVWPSGKPLIDYSPPPGRPDPAVTTLPPVAA